jgi:hypothetical protein
MSTKVPDMVTGALVIVLALATLTFFLMRRDDCLEKARDFVSMEPSVTAKTGKISSVGTSTWLSGQTAARAGQRSFYFLIKGERGSANAVVSADRASCTCRLDSVN